MAHRYSIALMAVALLAAGSVAAEEEAVTDADMFRLWTECKPVGLLVESLEDDGTAIGLAKEDILVAARSRLRAARIYAPDGVEYLLYLNVNITKKDAFSVSIEFYKRFEDLTSGRFGIATAWNIGSTGTHGDNASYVLSSVSKHLDKFIDEYLRVNAQACS